MRSILFVCTGNTCRSPMAEAILRHKVKGMLEVKSAGIFGAVGQSASDNTVQVLTEQAIPITHSAQQLNKELIEWADLILTMTFSHKEAVLTHYPQARDKVFTLSEYTNSGSEDINDPYGGPLEIYRETFRQMNQAISNLLKKLEK